MRLPALAVNRPVTTTMILVSIMVVGGIAMARLPLAFLPEVDIPFIGIQIPYPNSNPTQVEKYITKPVEEALATLPGVKKMRTTSTADNAEFHIEFRWGYQLDIVRMLVSEKLDQVKPSLPAGIGEIFIFSFNTSDIPVVQARIAAQGVDLSSNYSLLESRVKNRIRRVPGVARVDLDGVAPREIFIDLVLDKVKEHAVDIGSLIQRLQGASSNLVLGQVTQGGLRYTARALGAFESLEAIQGLTINDRGLKLSDIAEITYEEPPIAYGRHLDGEYAVAITVFKESTANTVDVVRAVTRVIEEDIGNDPLLQGIKLFVWQDQAEAITGGIDGLKSSGYIGAVLALLVLYFFLRRLDSTIIVSFSIPFSIIATCGVLYFMGKSLNILSMCGLMLGIGMLVDNAIVVLESIDRQHRDVPDTKVSALTGANHVALAVACSTLTSLIVFLPLIVGGGTEIFVWLKEIGISISLALVCSLFVSLTLIPLMSGHLLRHRRTAAPRSMVWLEDRYVRTLSWTLRHKAWTLVIVIVGLVVGFVPFMAGLVETTPFAGAINKRLRLQYEFADFVYKSDAERAVTAIEAHLRPLMDRYGFESIYSYYGENDAATILTLIREDLDDRAIKDLRKEIRAGLPPVPGARVFFQDDADEGGDSTYFAVKFYGQDAGLLQGYADEAVRRLETVAGIEDISTSLRKGRNEIQVVIDRDKALRNGLSAEDVSQIFQFTLGGMRLRRFNAGDREVETWLELRQEDRQNLEDLKKIQIGPPSRPVLLGDIAQFQVVRRAQEIGREDRKVRVAVNATYEGKSWGDARKEIEGLMNAFDLPPGYFWSWDDRILEQGQEQKQWFLNIVLALILVYIVMASLFESLAQPFAILFSIPFAMPGVAWFLTATRTPFNIMCWIGLLILIGVVVNNGIVLLDHMNQLRRAGVGREEAILAAGRDRLRAILMTALTTIVGLVPLAFGRAAVGGGPYYFPLARTVMGGMITSTFLTLIVLPYINLGVERAADWARGVWRLSSPRRLAAPAAGSALPVADSPAPPLPDAGPA